MLTVGSLFAGIGGFDLGFERAGFKTVWQVEIDEYCRKVLARHFPDAERFGDIRECGGIVYDDGAFPNLLQYVDVICGGFPCQPVSLAGSRLAQSDERWLWPQFARVVCEVRPQFVVVENVPGLLSAGLGDVLGDLAELGYDAEWQSVSAAAFDAPHIRDRVWLVANSNEFQHESGASPNERATAAYLSSNSASNLRRASRNDRPKTSHWRCASLADSNQKRRRGRTSVFGQGWRGESSDSGWWATEPNVGRVANGVPSRVDRLKGLGNAVVPQIAQWIAERIKQVISEFQAEHCTDEAPPGVE